MTETPQEAVPQSHNDVWHVDFHLQYKPDEVNAYFINCAVARRVGDPEAKDWRHEGCASFDAPAVVPPREGQEVIPYLLFHLDEVKQWLMEEHVRLTWNDAVEKFGPQVALPRLKAPMTESD